MAKRTEIAPCGERFSVATNVSQSRDDQASRGQAQTSAGTTAKPLNDWPESGLERLARCPICESVERELAYDDLEDRVYRCAPGRWTLWRCGECGSAYLDPRPTRATIGQAYATYFTHESPNTPPLSRWRQRRAAARAAFLNHSYGYALETAGRRVPPWLSERRRQRFEKYVAHLRYPGPGARLLDVGCGNGKFLLQMKTLGWIVAGIDPDAHSVAAAQQAGLDVKLGTLDPTTAATEAFDAVVLNHTIEHAHDPLDLLRECRRVLKPGGTLSIATPNVAAAGRRLYGRDWFPLDPPRHLVLFTPTSLRLALRKTGFEPEPAIRLRLTATQIFRGCEQLQHGGHPIELRPRATWLRRLRTGLRAWAADRRILRDPDLTDELVQLARPRLPAPQ
ncbi:MAG TPA: class I SAM-dependent methyltransferase [Candidatus Synoicihabitans sp.]|nr:class I SAM-dependent methyltransferase [Candidatus Synoicihabitans sp.]